MSDPTPKPARARHRRRRRLPVGSEILIALVLVSLVQGFVVKVFGVPSTSMERTLEIGDRIVANRLDHTIARGDVVVFGHGDTWETARRSPASSLPGRAVRAVGDVTGLGPSNTNYTVKRVIGLPGERVACCDAEGRVTVDDTPLTEPYVFEDFEFVPGQLDCQSEPQSSRCFGEVTVSADSYLVLGDHRTRSADSVAACRGGPRASGCARLVHADRIIGPVIFRLWPPTSLGPL